jgi:hypothetical protein
MLGQFSRLAVYVRGDRRHASDGVGGDHRGENMDMHVGSEPWSVQKRGIPCKPRLSMLSLETRTDTCISKSMSRWACSRLETNSPRVHYQEQDRYAIRQVRGQ